MKCRSRRCSPSTFCDPKRGPTGPTGAFGGNGATGPTGPTGPLGETLIFSAVSPSSTVENPPNTDFTDLITLPINVPAGFGDAIIEASLSALALGDGPGSFRLAIDGAPLSASGSEVPESPSLAQGRFYGGAIIRHVPLAPGAYTISLQWRAPANGVVIVASNPDRSHASLVVTVT